jgi:hypothetical protein
MPTALRGHAPARSARFPCPAACKAAGRAPAPIASLPFNERVNGRFHAGVAGAAATERKATREPPDRRHLSFSSTWRNRYSFSPRWPIAMAAARNAPRGRGPQHWQPPSTAVPKSVALQKARGRRSDFSDYVVPPLSTRCAGNRLGYGQGNRLRSLRASTRRRLGGASIRPRARVDGGLRQRARSGSDWPAARRGESRFPARRGRQPWLSASRFSSSQAKWPNRARDFWRRRAGRPCPPDIVSGRAGACLAAQRAS